ncbi:hypothetical protein [Undibacterium sp. TS12]|uniref:hypothetical protein n=1 Tax=Undibacterium sp. TS12 TaxID=2908202 RepID=UPI001F4C685B|nr:hypothetical protein [Undibacterium sp. TS12]MCH8618669.1 hypothetical protein [Undibacterium sp. TS12]
MTIKLPVLFFLSYAWTMAQANAIIDNPAPVAPEERQARLHLEIHQAAPLTPLPPFPPISPMPALAALAELPETSTINKTVSDAMSAARNAADAMHAVFSGMQDMQSFNPIKNAAYSAEIITEKTQTLADGNQISNKMSSLVYRDNAGRTRYEVRDNKGNVSQILITDPVENSRYVIIPDRKMVTKVSLPKTLDRKVATTKEKQEGNASRVYVQTNDDEIIIKTLKKKSDDKTEGSKEAREEIKVINAKSATFVPGPHTAFINATDNLINIIRTSPLPTAFTDTRWSSKTSTKDMGTKDFDGVRAEGKMRSYQIPAGEIGNKNPITVSSETWYSPDLQLTVLIKQSDPRTGEWSYRLNNLKRAEPAANLFTVPEGYTVRDVNLAQKIVIEKREEKKP